MADVTSMIDRSEELFPPVDSEVVDDYLKTLTVKVESVDDDRLKPLVGKTIDFETWDVIRVLLMGRRVSVFPNDYFESLLRDLKDAFEAELEVHGKLGDERFGTHLDVLLTQITALRDEVVTTGVEGS